MSTTTCSAPTYAPATSGPTDVERSSICYQKHKSQSGGFLSPICQIFSKSAEQICDPTLACNSAAAVGVPAAAVPAVPAPVSVTPPSNVSPDHANAVKRGGSGKRGTGSTLLKRVSGSVRRSQSANTHKEIPMAALKLRERAEAFRAAAARLEGDSERIEEEGELPAFDEETTATAAELYSTLNEKNKKRSTIAGVFQNLIFLRKASTPDSVETRLDKLLKQQKPPLDTLLLWGRSLDALLNDKYGLQLFRGFLRTEFSDENIEFWIECENYKNIPERKLAAKAQKIYDDFIAVQAPREVNLDSKTRLHTIAAMSSPNQHTFELAQRRIQSLMEKDSYQRFLRSELYCSILKQSRDETQSQTSAAKSNN